MTNGDIYSLVGDVLSLIGLIASLNAATGVHTLKKTLGVEIALRRLHVALSAEAGKLGKFVHGDGPSPRPDLARAQESAVQVLHHVLSMKLAMNDKMDSAMETAINKLRLVQGTNPYFEDLRQAHLAVLGLLVSVGNTIDGSKKP